MINLAEFALGWLMLGAVLAIPSLIGALIWLVGTTIQRGIRLFH